MYILPYQLHTIYDITWGGWMVVYCEMEITGKQAVDMIYVKMIYVHYGKPEKPWETSGCLRFKVGTSWIEVKSVTTGLTCLV